MTATLGLGEIVGQALTLARRRRALLVWCVILARRGDDERAFTCAVAATLALSPIVWLHYLVALLVPLAILRPRFSAIWLLPVLLWVSPKPGYAEGFATFMPAVAAAFSSGCSSSARRRGRPLRRESRELEGQLDRRAAVVLGLESSRFAWLASVVVCGVLRP